TGSGACRTPSRRLGRYGPARSARSRPRSAVLRRLGTSQSDHRILNPVRREMVQLYDGITEHRPTNVPPLFTSGDPQGPPPERGAHRGTRTYGVEWVPRIPWSSSFRSELPDRIEVVSTGKAPLEFADGPLRRPR